MDELAFIYWIVALVQMGISVAIYIPALYYYWRYRDQHHMITKSFLLLVIPDLILLANYIPLHAMAVVDGATLPGPGCSASAAIILAGIVASNVGSVGIAVTTQRMLDVNDRGVTHKSLWTWAITGWVAGAVLGGSYAGAGVLGPHRNLYCCMENGLTSATSLPTFFVFGFAVSTMSYYYFKAVRQVKQATEISTIAKRRSTGSNTAARGLIKRAIQICGIYYATWSLVALLSALEWGGVEFSRWWDAVAAWQIKAGPILDSCLLLYTVRKVNSTRQTVGSQQSVGQSSKHEQKALYRAESSQLAGTVPATPNQVVLLPGSSPSMQGRPLMSPAHISSEDSPLMAARGLRPVNSLTSPSAGNFRLTRVASNPQSTDSPINSVRKLGKPLLGAEEEPREEASPPPPIAMDIRVDSPEPVVHE